MTACATGQSCSNGECATGCTNECSFVGIKQCSGNGFQTCGNYDVDSCLEWSSSTNCPTGEYCINNACESSTKQVQCTDSDGGENIYIKGNTGIETIDIDSDFCVINQISGKTCRASDFPQKCMVEECSDSDDNCSVAELSCPLINAQDIGVQLITCPNGCKDGACIYNDQEVCSELITNPVIQKKIGDYVLVNQDIQEGYEEYFGERATVHELKYERNQKEIRVYVFYIHDTTKKIKDSPLIDMIRKNFWSIEHSWVESEEYQYYIIGENKEYFTLWHNENVLILISQEIRDGEDNTIDAVLEKIQNNKFESISQKMNSRIRQFIELYMNSCPSTVDESCIPQWKQKNEPLICPPQGYQTEIIQDVNNCLEERKEQIQCSPGICAGCFVPRWSGARDNVCIPYETRLVFEEGDYFTAYESELNDEFVGSNYFEFKIIDDYNAIINAIKDVDDDFEINVNRQTFYGKIGESYPIYEGKPYTGSFLGDNHAEEFSIHVNDINYNKKYIKFTMIDTYPAYCNYDGKIKKQKTNDSQGNWASCQNNYECESNVCSLGKCIEAAQTIKQIKGLRAFLIKILCRLGNVFNKERYGQCIFKYLR